MRRTLLFLIVLVASTLVFQAVAQTTQPTTRQAEMPARVPVDVLSFPVEKTKVGHYRWGEQSYDVFIVAEPTTRPY